MTLRSRNTNRNVTRKSAENNTDKATSSKKGRRPDFQMMSEVDGIDGEPLVVTHGACWAFEPPNNQQNGGINLKIGSLPLGDEFVLMATDDFDGDIHTSDKEGEPDWQRLRHHQN